MEEILSDPMWVDGRFNCGVDNECRKVQSEPRDGALVQTTHCQARGKAYSGIAPNRYLVQ